MVINAKVKYRVQKGDRECWRMQFKSGGQGSCPGDVREDMVESEKLSTSLS